MSLAFVRNGCNISDVSWHTPLGNQKFMKTITRNVIMAYDDTHETLVNSTVSNPGLVMSRRDGHLVTSYFELLTKVANLSYYNPRFQLLFRGQSKDYPMSDKATSSNLLPSILRGFTP